MALLKLPNDKAMWLLYIKRQKKARISSFTMSKPCSQLNSKLIRDAAECHLVGPIQNLCSVISFKCIWRVDEIENAWSWICSKREECDTALAKLKEVSFFFSAISTSKLKQAKMSEEAANEESGRDDEETVVASQVSTPGKQIYPAISYWVACQITFLDGDEDNYSGSDAETFNKLSIATAGHSACESDSSTFY
ncbi:uncharacterized protein LOC125561246 [Nematostella vectensis]|uniref:uncharacterized protein LOC125561246 n=1 Tax=Nematostella vectensis TaxID=45351 RepID=UPI0020772966|nr:uncharacterized protein LOC125561246 [Nematostella vectensis]